MFLQSSRNFDSNSVATHFTGIFLFVLVHPTNISKSFVERQRRQQTFQVRLTCHLPQFDLEKTRVHPCKWVAATVFATMNLR